MGCLWICYLNYCSLLKQGAKHIHVCPGEKIKLLLNLVDHSYQYWRVWVTAFLSVPDKQCTCIPLPFNSGLCTWSTNSVSVWCYLRVTCLCFEGLHQLCFPTCSLKEEPQKDGQIPLLGSHIKTISPPSPFFTCAQIFNYTDFLFSHCCSM